MRNWAGPLITVAILVGVVLILALNLNLGPNPPKPEAKPSTTPTPTPPAPTFTRVKPKDFREYPIGSPVEKNGIQVAAVWLPPVAMDGQPMAGTDVIHLEADVRATEGNPNGFALGEFVPYLKIAYTITPASGGPPVQKGDLMPMVAADGLHYGASVSMPKAGIFTLTYAIQPPSSGGLGRHSDPVTGVEPWWEPFEVAFDWEYEGPPGGKK
jgi:uncharacterized protein involved in high-affinity Fe2+ transport